MILARAGSSQDGKGIFCIHSDFFTSAGNRIARRVGFVSQPRAKRQRQRNNRAHQGQVDDGQRDARRNLTGRDALHEADQRREKISEQQGDHKHRERFADRIGRGQQQRQQKHGPSNARGFGIDA